MKILQINANESPGRRFNGLSIAPLLKKYDVHSKHLVWEKDTDNPDVLSFGGPLVTNTNRIIKKIERTFSLQSVLYLNSSRLLKMPAFQEADLIHLHIIHTGYFNLSDLKHITAKKPTVWTLHDPWPLTGHCIHPKECERWKIGCGSCPDLKTQIPLSIDTTRLLFNYKKNSYKKAQLELIVASKWMKDMVEQSPMFENAKIHQLPFGIDLNFFSPIYEKSARAKFNIEDDTIVISFRGVYFNEYKGVSYIIDALKQIQTKQKICLIITNSQNFNLYTDLHNRFRIINFDWIDDEELMRDIMAASDIFLMPSLAETFGLMALEALASNTAIIVFDGTALPDVVFAPDVGIVVPSRDHHALTKSLQNLIDNKEERKKRKILGREIAEKYYDQEIHVKNLVEIYKNLIK